MDVTHYPRDKSLIFADNIVHCILIDILLKFISEALIDHKSTMLHVKSSALN